MTTATFRVDQNDPVFQTIRSRLDASGQFRDEAGRFDAVAGLFVANQLTAMLGELYEWKVPPREMRKILPVDTSSVPDWAETFNYTMFEPIGAAVLAASYQAAIPRADVVAHEFTGKMRPILTQYGYTMQELKQAAANRVSLDGTRGRAARLAYEHTWDDTVRTGSTAFNLAGMFNHANIPIVSALTKAAGGTSWANATPDEMVADVAEALQSVVSQTSNTYETLSVVVLPATRYTQAMTTRMGDGSDRTVLQFLQSIYAGAQFVSSSFLETAGGGGVKRIVAGFMASDTATTYENAFAQEPPRQEGAFEWRIVCSGRTSGAVVVQPLAFAYVDGI